MSRDTVYIFDISNMIHRAYHATGELHTSYGFPTGAIWGTLNMMLRFIDKHKPTHILVCYDAQTPKSVRKDIYPEYKANRVKVSAVSSEELIIRRFFELFNIATVELEGYEADDLIATAVTRLKDNMNIIIVTGDKDMLQLIQPGVQVFDSMKNVWYDDQEALKKFGVLPNQIGDYLALVGDAADNIPGVEGIGPKGAVKLLAEYESLSGIQKNTHLISNLKLREKLEKGAESARLSKQLINLFDNLPVEMSPNSVIFKPVESPSVYELLDKLEFKNIKTKIEMMWQAYE
jgi:DNA polymerase I